MMSPPSSKFADYEEFSKHELPRLVRTGLEKLVSEEMQPLEESLKGKLVDLIRDSQQSILDKFKAVQTSTQSAQTYANKYGEPAMDGMPWSTGFSNKTTTKEIPGQLPYPVATAYDAPHLQQVIGNTAPEDFEDPQWALFSPPPPLDCVLQDLDNMLPEKRPGGEYSDSGYATLCMCNSSEQSTVNSGFSNQHEGKGKGQQSDSFSKDNNSKPSSSSTADQFVDLWSTESSFLGGLDQFDFMLPKCERCGGDKGLSVECPGFAEEEGLK